MKKMNKKIKEEIREILIEMHKYLYDVCLIEDETNKCALERKKIEEFYKRLNYSVLYPKEKGENND